MTDENATREVSGKTRLEALSKKMTDSIGGFGSVESFIIYFGNIHYIPALVPIRMQMKDCSIYFERALAACEEKMRNRPLRDRSGPILRGMGVFCPKCGATKTLWEASDMQNTCKCGATFQYAYEATLKELLDQHIIPTPEAVYAHRAYDRLAEAYRLAYHGMYLITQHMKEANGWKEFHVNNSKLRDYWDQLFLGKILGEQHVMDEEKKTLQLLTRGPAASIPLCKYENGLEKPAPICIYNLITDLIAAVKYGYLYEGLGVDGALELYQQKVQAFNPAYNQANAYIETKLGQSRESSHSAIELEEGNGKYAPFWVMDPRCWETGTLTPTLIMKLCRDLDIHPRFDFGAIVIFLAPPGSGKCLTYETQVVTNRGVESIGNVVENALKYGAISDGTGLVSFDNNIGLSVPSIDPQTLKVSWQKVTSFYKSAVTKTVSVKTISGRQFTATMDHTFVVLEHEKIKVVNGEELTEEHYIPLAKKIPLPTVKSKYTTDWMKLFGIYVAEGCIMQTNQKYPQKYPIISFSEEKEASEIKAIVEKLGYVATFRRKQRLPHGINDLRLSSKLADVLEQFGDKAPFKGKGRGASRKKIPNFMFLESPENIETFLEYYFKGDGWIERSNEKTLTKKLNDHNVCTSKSKELIDGINTLLLKIGKISTIRKKTLRTGRYTGNSYWGCSYPDNGHHSVYTHRSFERIDVKDALRQLTKYLGVTYRDLGKALSPTRNAKSIFDKTRKFTFSIPFIKRALRETTGFLVKYPYPLRLKYLENEAEVRRQFIENKITETELKEAGFVILSGKTSNLSIITMPREIKKALLQRDLEKAASLLNSLYAIVSGDVYFDKILSIEKTETSQPTPVYDLTVNKNHTFLLANGLFVHNTFTESAIITDAFLNTDEFVFSPLGDESNNFTTACLPLFPYDKRTNKLYNTLTRKLGVKSQGIPLQHLTFLGKDEPFPDKNLNPPTIFDIVIRFDDAESLEVDFKKIFEHHREINEWYGLKNKTKGLITVRNLNRSDRKTNTNLDLKILAALLEQFNKYRKSHPQQPGRVFVDELSYSAASQIDVGGSDASKSGGLMVDNAKETRRNNASFDGGTQNPKELLSNLRKAVTTLFFRELAQSNYDKGSSEIDYVVGTLKFDDPEIRPIIRQLNETGIPKGMWFGHQRDKRRADIYYACPPVFCLNDVGRTPLQILRHYDNSTAEQLHLPEKQLGERKILLKSWSEVPVWKADSGQKKERPKVWL